MDIDVVDIDHIAIDVSNIEQSIEFYNGLLGMEIRDFDRFEEGTVPYVAVVAGGRHIHLVPTEGGISTTGEHICVLIRSNSVDSRDEMSALLEHLQDRGVEVESSEPYKRYGAYGRAWAAYIRDPDGRRVELKIH